MSDGQLLASSEPSYTKDVSSIMGGCTYRVSHMMLYMLVGLSVYMHVA